VFSLRASGRFLLNALVIATSFWLLLPTTLLFVFGLFASIYSLLQLQFGGSSMFFTSSLVLPGAGLGAVWWLTFAFPFINSIRSIPRVVWIGLLLGIAFAMGIFIWTARVWNARAHLATEFSFISLAKDVFLEMLDFGGGPLAASILLIAGIWFRQLYAEKHPTRHA